MFVQWHLGYKKKKKKKKQYFMRYPGQAPFFLLHCMYNMKCKINNEKNKSE